MKKINKENVKMRVGLKIQSLRENVLMHIILYFSKLILMVVIKSSCGHVDEREM